jgi:hypothetical protein
MELVGWRRPIAHEYGHYLLHIGVGIEYDQGLGFHEGFGDTLSHLIHDTEVMGQDFRDCGVHEREPVVANRMYPDCDEIAHTRGMVLSKVWLNLLGNLRNTYGHSHGYDITRDLHLDWMLIAQPPGPHHEQCTDLDQSASPATLIEVLTVAADDYVEQICEAFGDQLIFHEACPDSAGSRPYADCDGDGVLTFWDFLCFQNAFIAGDPYADCDRDARLTFFDFLCFQNEFLTAAR